MMDGVESLPFGLKPEVIEKIRAVLAACPEVEQVIVYGSRAMDTYRKGSDIDITLLGENLAWEHLQRISSALDDLLLPWKIDISLFKQIENPELAAHIQRVGKVFYKKQAFD